MSSDNAKPTIEAVYNYLKGYRSPQKQDASSQLKDYFEDLNMMKESCLQVKQVAEDTAQKYRDVSLEKNILEQEAKNLRENLTRKSNRCDKLKETIQTYKKDIVKLIAQVEFELERLKKYN